MRFADLILSPLHFILDPTKRLFFLYFISSTLLALAVLYQKDKSISKAIDSLCDKRVWFNPSSRLDVSLLILNSVIKTVLFVVVIFSSIEVSRVIVKNLVNLFPDYEPLKMGFTTTAIAYTLLSFLALDFSRFFQHYLFHKIPFLWSFHKVHHTATVLTPITLYRTHPIESVMAALRRTLVVGSATGLFIFATQSKIDGYAILGINLFDFVFNMFGSNLRHSHVWLSFGKFDSLFISPAHHQIHHSRNKKHHDKNLGFCLSIWDQLFGTFYSVSQKEFLIFGVKGEKDHGLNHALFEPFRESRGLIKKPSSLPSLKIDHSDKEKKEVGLSLSF